MNCKGCIHCQYMGIKQDEYIGISFHFCDIYPEKDSIGDAFKWCEGANYENEEGKRYYEI